MQWTTSLHPEQRASLRRSAALPRSLLPCFSRGAGFAPLWGAAPFCGAAPLAHQQAASFSAPAAVAATLGRSLLAAALARAKRPLQPAAAASQARPGGHASPATSPCRLWQRRGLATALLFSTHPACHLPSCGGGLKGRCALSASSWLAG